MANIALISSPAPQVFPFHTLQGADLQYTAVPRGRVTFRVNDLIIAAKIATNTTSIRITMDLPANFSYVQEWVQADIILATDPAEASQFDAVGSLALEGTGTGSRDSQLFSEGVYATTLNAGSGRAWSAVDPFPLPIFSPIGSQLRLVLAVNDSDAVNATVAGLFNSTVTFLMYDFEQVFNVPLNYPTPVQLR